MKSFDDFVKENFKNLTGSTREFMREAFEAGQQSRQAEVDELQRKLSLCEALRDNQFEHLLEVKEQRDVAQRNLIESQKRIDVAWSWCEKGCVLKAMEILKGKSE